MLFDLHDAIAPLPGSTKARALLVQQGLEYLDTLNNQSGADLDLKREVADGYMRLGSIQGEPSASNIGDTPGAVKSYEKAVALFEQLLRQDPQDRRSILRLCAAYRALASLEATFGNSDVEDQLFQKARQLGDADSTAHPDDESAPATTLPPTTMRSRLSASQQSDTTKQLSCSELALKSYERDLAEHPGVLIAIQGCGALPQTHRRSPRCPEKDS